MAKKRTTPRKEAILRMLEADYEEGGRDSLAREFGRPPLTATTIAEYIDWFDGENGRPECNAKPGESVPLEIAFWHPSASTVQSFARTLRAMTAEGLLVQVREKQQTRNALAGDHIDMPRVAYYSLRAMASNIEAKEAERAHRAWLKETPEGQAYETAQIEAFCCALAGVKPAQPTAPQLPGDVIDGCITEVSGTDDTTRAATEDPEYIPF
jgi:hypothetical protein